MENLTAWKKLSQPPKEALREIQAGRLRGKTDINPQWRYKAMTEVFGPCGVGWYYTIDKQWLEPGPEGQVFAFCNVAVFIKDGDKWGAGIPGTGGSFLVAKESTSLHANDEAFKMATTDALSVAMKMLGVGADVYAGLWDGAKYRDQAAPATPKPEQTQPRITEPSASATEPQLKAINTILTKLGVTDEFGKHQRVSQVLNLPIVITSLKNLTKQQASDVIEKLGGK